MGNRSAGGFAAFACSERRAGGSAFWGAHSGSLKVSSSEP